MLSLINLAIETPFLPASSRSHANCSLRICICVRFMSYPATPKCLHHDVDRFRNKEAGSLMYSSALSNTVEHCINPMFLYLIFLAAEFHKVKKISPFAAHNRICSMDTKLHPYTTIALASYFLGMIWVKDRKKVLPKLSDSPFSEMFAWTCLSLLGSIGFLKR